LKNDIDLSLCFYDYIFYINPNVISKYDPKSSGHVLPKFDSETNSFTFRTYLEKSSNEVVNSNNYDEERKDFKIKYDRLKKFFNFYFGEENVTFKTKFVYKYNKCKFDTNFLSKQKEYPIDFWEQVYNSIGTEENISVSQKSNVIGIDFNWKEENIDDILMYFNERCSSVNFSYYGKKHKCNIDFQVQNISLDDIEQNLRDYFPSIHIKKDNKEGKLYFYQEYQTLEQSYNLKSIIEEELKASPIELATKKPTGKGLDGLGYRIQVSTLDCVGCGSCAHVCPANALDMMPIADSLNDKEDIKADYLFNNVQYRSDLMPVDTVKGSQFAQPLFEFHGACPGCGETPYIKLITQLYGNRMMVANATGCSSIYSGSAPSTPYTTDANGEGPSWGSSLFEDNAEYGFGMHIGVEALRDRIQHTMEENMDKVDEDIATLFKDWIANRQYSVRTREVRDILVPKLEALNTDFAKEILDLKQYLVKKSQWIIGGDGWAYDIGYGGLDHVLASNEDINVLVMDTEVYSNTGGQASKATPTGAVAKFAAAGKPVKKKDLAAIAMSYGHIYVAQVSMGANQQQFIKAVKEAEAHQGPSIIIAYSPCINHGIKKGMSKSQTEMKLATECGYWPIFRYNPSLEKIGKNPLQIDSKEPKWEKYEEYLTGEVRYQTLAKSNPEEAKILFETNKKDAQKRWRQYKRMAALDYSEEKEAE